jgi:hypothetical protein
MALPLLWIALMSTPAQRPLSIHQLVLQSAFALCVFSGSGCHPHPRTLVTATSAAVGGTIAGVVTGPADRTLEDRTVTVVNIDTSAQYKTATGENGGYTLRVPPGRYRIEIQLRENEQMAEKDAPILVVSGGIDVQKNVDVNQSRQ